MLRHRITLDNFMKLSSKELEFALRNMQQELAGTIDLLASDPAAQTDEVLLEELSSLLTLRKVLRGRAEELRDDVHTSAVVVTSAGALASHVYQRNQLLAVS